MLNLTPEQIEILITENNFYHGENKVAIEKIYTDDNFDDESSECWDNQDHWDKFIVYPEETRWDNNCREEDLYFYSYNRDGMGNFGINLGDFKRGYYDKGIIYIISKETSSWVENNYLDGVQFECQAIEKLKHENLIDGDPALPDEIIAELLGFDDNNSIAEISW